MKKILTVITVATLYILCIWNFDGSYSNAKEKYSVEYNGLLWVGLDYYSIHEYQSNDIPMKWVEFKKTINSK